MAQPEDVPSSPVLKASSTTTKPTPGSSADSFSKPAPALDMLVGALHTPSHTSETALHTPAETTLHTPAETAPGTMPATSSSTPSSAAPTSLQMTIAHDLSSSLQQSSAPTLTSQPSATSMTSLPSHQSLYSNPSMLSITSHPSVVTTATSSATKPGQPSTMRQTRQQHTNSLDNIAFDNFVQEEETTSLYDPMDVAFMMEDSSNMHHPGFRQKGSHSSFTTNNPNKPPPPNNPSVSLARRSSLTYQQPQASSMFPIQDQINSGTTNYNQTTQHTTNAFSSAFDAAVAQHASHASIGNPATNDDPSSSFRNVGDFASASSNPFPTHTAGDSSSVGASYPTPAGSSSSATTPNDPNNAYRDSINGKYHPRNDAEEETLYIDSILSKIMQELGEQGTPKIYQAMEKAASLVYREMKLKVNDKHVELERTRLVVQGQQYRIWHLENQFRVILKHQQLRRQQLQQSNGVVAAAAARQQQSDATVRSFQQGGAAFPSSMHGVSGLDGKRKFYDGPAASGAVHPSITVPLGGVPPGQRAHATPRNTDAAGFPGLSSISPVNHPGPGGKASPTFNARKRPKTGLPSIPAGVSKAAPNPPTSKSKWSKEQDEALRAAVEKFNGKKWKRIAEHVEGRDHVQCLQRWKKVLQPGLIKGPWTSEEDAILFRLLMEEDVMSWTLVSKYIPGRTAKQCRERWTLSLDPSINRNAWTDDEDERLLQVQETLGNRWSEIKEYFDGRTENAVKTRFKSLSRAKSKNWSPELDTKLCALVKELGPDWKTIATRMKRARSEPALKARAKVLLGNDYGGAPKTEC